MSEDSHGGPARVDPSPEVPTWYLRPLGRRLLANTPAEDRRKLHDILALVERHGTQAAILARELRLMSVTDRVLQDLEVRGFVTRRRDAGDLDRRAGSDRDAQSLGPTSGEVVARSREGQAARSAPESGTRTLTEASRTSAFLNSPAMEFEPVALDKLRQAERLKQLESELHKTLQTTQTLSRRKTYENLQRLSPMATRLLEILPESVSVSALLERFPRILNRLAEDWRDPERFNATMHSYFVDDRGGRQGFPLDVLQELMDLHTYYNTEIHPSTKKEGLGEGFFKR